MTATRTGRTRRSLPRPPLAIAACGLVVLAGLTAALLGPAAAPYDPMAENLLAGLQPPGPQHWLGTDDSGRDILSRIIAGTRSAIVGPAGVVLVAALIGTTLGLLAGYFGGALDTAVTRLADLLYSLPALLVAIVLIGVIGGGYGATVVVLVLLTVPVDTRMIRGATLEQRSLPYVAAATTLGLSHARIIVRHILPNVAALVVANLFLNLAQVLVVLAALSFLGLGVPPGAADWGRMLSENFPLVQSQPVAALAPGVALVVFAVAMNLLGDWVHETLSDRGRSW